MILENKLNIKSEIELAKEEERISKLKAIELFKSGYLDTLDAGTYESLSNIHKKLFEDIYDFAWKLRTVNISKGNSRFAPIRYLENTIKQIELMPQGTFDEIIEKYVEMNVAHPFREGNGRSMRIWVDAILKQELKRIVEWSLINKEDYLSAMERSHVKDIEIKYLMKNALSDKINDELFYLKGLDASYSYEGYTLYNSEEQKEK